MTQTLSGALRSRPALGRMALYVIPDVRWTVNVRGVGPMAVRLRRNRSYWLRDPLQHEAFMLGTMQRLINPGGVAFDVGANIGLYVRLMIQQFAAGRVVAFEPYTQNLALLRRNVQLGNCQDRVEIAPIALADYEGTDDFQIDDVSTATGTLNAVARGGPSEARRQYGLPAATETVTVASLDSLVESGALPVPHFIKVDIEGAEELFLRGACRTLQRHGPNLAIELHGVQSAAAVVRLLLQIGYPLFGFLDGRNGVVYKEVVASDIDEITTPYSLHHCAASRDRALLSAPIDLGLCARLGFAYDA